MHTNPSLKDSKYLSRRRFLQLSGLTAAGLACIGMNPLTLPGRELHAAYFPGDSWRTSTPEAQGIDSSAIAAMLEQIHAGSPYVHSFLLIRNGTLVSEAYFAPVTRAHDHILFSTTKSILSALIGISIDEGFIKNVEQKVIDYFPQIKKLNPDKNLDKLKIKHLLSMTSGHAFQVSPNPYQSPPVDWVEKFLGNPVNPILYEPGSTFLYTSGAPHTLSAILQQTTGKTAAEYAAEKLFKPLGITGYDWLSDQNGITFGNSWLRLKPSDMARLGYLYLNRGLWNGKQIIPQQWVNQSTQKQIETRGVQINAAEQDGYACLWWMNSFDGYAAHGYGGQFIFVVPALNLVAVFTGGFDDDVFDSPYKLMRDFIIPGVKQTFPLPEAPKAYQNLQDWLDRISKVTSKAVTPLPEIARKLSGKTFVFPDQTRISFTFNHSAEYDYQVNTAAGGLTFHGGLDDVYRLNDINNGLYSSNIVAVKGYWQDETTFINSELPLDNITCSVSACSFKQDQLIIDNKTMISGKTTAKTTLTGTLV
ncbi:MAG: beta-lactamase family protein [Anaerolineae bacterium]|nr:beta-lactamase family protein [Anaerolineae bacterium]